MSAVFTLLRSVPYSAGGMAMGGSRLPQRGQARSLPSATSLEPEVQIFALAPHSILVSRADPGDVSETLDHSSLSTLGRPCHYRPARTLAIESAIG
jgi:hypothetical protein